MEYIQKLPLLLAAGVAVIVGLICNLLKVNQQDTYIRMIVFMVVAFVLGLYIRNSLQKIYDELEMKRIEEEKRQALEHEKAKKQQEEEEERKKQEALQPKTGTQIDLKVSDDGEDFSPMTVSEYIKTEN